DRDESGAHRVAASLGRPEGEVLVRIHDVADETAWDATASAVRERFGRLDLCVANAGIADAGEIADLDFARWRRVLATNLDGVFLTLRACFRLLREQGRGGSVVVV